MLAIVRSKVFNIKAQYKAHYIYSFTTKLIIEDVIYLKEIFRSHSTLIVSSPL